MGYRRTHERRAPFERVALSGVPPTPTDLGFHRPLSAAASENYLGWPSNARWPASWRVASRLTCIELRPERFIVIYR